MRACQTPCTKMQFVLEFQKLFTCNHIWLFVPVRTQINSTDIFFSLFFFPLKFYQKENISEMYVQCNLSPTDVWKFKYFALKQEGTLLLCNNYCFYGKSCEWQKRPESGKIFPTSNTFFDCLSLVIIHFHYNRFAFASYTMRMKGTHTFFVL